MRTLKTFFDERGVLFELFRSNKDDVAMAYVVTIHPGFGRDIDQWHCHKYKTESFICLSGLVKIAVLEKDGHVYNKVLQQKGFQDCSQDMVIVQPGEGHSLYNPFRETAVVLVLCDNYYDPEDEGRKPMTDWSW